MKNFVVVYKDNCICYDVEGIAKFLDLQRTFNPLDEPFKVYYNDDGQLYKVEEGDLARFEDMSENSIYYGSYPLTANEKIVGYVCLSDS